MTQVEFLNRLDAIINERHLLQHPFYILWNEGKLTKEMLSEYAKEYYHQVHYFPTYVSAIHSNCEDMDVRQMLLENLIEEEHGPNNHPELWLRFGDALGVSREEMKNHKYLPHTKQSISILKELSKREKVHEAISSLYAYESQIPAVSKTKIEGLKNNYNLDTEDALIFFQVHEEADVLHSQVTRDALCRLCDTPEKMEEALDAAREAADAINLLLDGVYETHCTEAMTAQA